jgi:hypothetical protein
MAASSLKDDAAWLWPTLPLHDEDEALITITVTNRLQVGPADRISRSVAAKIRARLTFPNPAYLNAEKRGYSTLKYRMLFTKLGGELNRSIF